jgi:hypothetical protein
MFYFLLEGLGIMLFGFLGSYIMWLVYGKKKRYEEILEQYGYGLGFLGIIVMVILIAILK